MVIGLEKCYHADMSDVALATIAEASQYFRRAKADNTRRAYGADWRHFSTWCAQRGREALPASVETLVVYLTELARTHKAGTLSRRLSAVSQAHQAVGLVSLTSAAPVRTLMAGIRRAKGTSSAGKRPVSIEDLQAMLGTLPDNPGGLRSRALLLVGFAGAFRRSELVGLNWGDVEFGNQGLTVVIRRSKTDPEGQGRKIGIPYGQTAQQCPVRCLAAWRDQAGGAGPIFRPIDRNGKIRAARLSDKAVARIVKRAIEAAGRDPHEYAGHSLRAGLATAAALGGASERAIMNQTGHRSLVTVRRYIRDGSLFRDNAASQTGL